MSNKLLSELKSKLQKTQEHLKSELATIRSGKVSSALVENIQIDVYETKMKIAELATISIPEPNLIVIQPWDASVIPSIEKAIRESSLNISPVVDENIVRLPLPPLTQERREEFVKLAKKKVEDSRVAIRNIRREAIDTVKKRKEEGDVSEDEEHRLKKQIEEEVEKALIKIDAEGERKEKDLLEI